MRNRNSRFRPCARTGCALLARLRKSCSWIVARNARIVRRPVRMGLSLFINRMARRLSFPIRCPVISVRISLASPPARPMHCCRSRDASRCSWVWRGSHINSARPARVVTPAHQSVPPPRCPWISTSSDSWSRRNVVSAVGYASRCARQSTIILLSGSPPPAFVHRGRCEKPICSNRSLLSIKREKIKGKMLKGCFFSWGQESRVHA